MADIKKDKAEEPVKAPVAITEAEQSKHDETVPGGRYILNGMVVNAEGKVIEGLSVKDGEIVE